MHSINWWNQNHLGAPRGLQLVSRKVKNFTYAFSKRCPFSNTFFIIRLRNSHNHECHKLMKSEILGYKYRGEERRAGGHWPRKGVWGCAALKDPLFTPLLWFARVPFQTKESIHKTPLWENLEILASTASIFAKILAHKPQSLEIFSSQAPKFGNFQLTSPLFQRQVPVRKPHTLEIRAAHPCLKKVECPPPEELHICKMHRDVTSKWVDFTQKIGKGWSHFDTPPKRISKHGSNG